VTTERPADRANVRTILARMDPTGALSRDDQAALARELSIGIQQLPAQLRGGLIGIVFGSGPESRDG